MHIPNRYIVHSWRGGDRDSCDLNGISLMGHLRLDREVGQATCEVADELQEYPLSAFTLASRKFFGLRLEVTLGFLRSAD